MENDKTEELKIMPRGITDGKQGNMIAVASGKGGVGKTWFSITLAQTLSGLRQKVLLFDGDLGLANVDIQLGLMTKHDLGSVVTGEKTLNQVISHSDKGRFDIIAGRSGSAGLASMPLGRLQILGEDLKLVEDYLKDLEEITVEDLENTIREYIDLNHAVISVLLPEA